MTGKLVLYKYLIFLVLCLQVSLVSAQPTTTTEINQQRLNRNKASMLVLGSWAMLNISSGLILRSTTEGSTKYFHEMNAIWNGVNLGIAALGYFQALKTDPSSFSIWETYAEQQKLEKILLFNAALNISYMLSGAYLIERSRRNNKNTFRLKGYGQSLILQGGFLLLFDTIQFWVHNSNGQDQLKQLFQTLHFQGGQIGLTLNF